MTAAPLGFTVALIPFTFLFNEVGRTSWLADAVFNWFFLLFFGAVVTVPIMIGGLITASLLPRFSRGASAAAIFVLLVSCGFAALLIYVGYADALTEPTFADDTRWTPKLSLPSAALFALPLLLLLAGNARAIRLLRRSYGM